MLRALESGRYLNMGFVGSVRVFAIVTHNQTFAIKTATQPEKPRYVVFALQTGRKNVRGPIWLQIDQREILSELGMLSVRWHESGFR